MNTNFINEKISTKEIETTYDLLLIENCSKQINEISDFLQNDKKLLLINGFKGSGKSTITNFVLTQLKPEVISIRYTCFETTILDDMLLSFFETFKNYTLEGKIEAPRVKVDNFTQKINSYFNTILAPIIITIDSFDSILKSNRQDILNFIHHLCKFQNIKVIITSQKFEYEQFETDYDKTTIPALSKEIFEKYLREHGIKQIGVLSNELYNQSKGYYGAVELAVTIMNNREYNITKFLDVFSKSLMPFQEFVVREGISLIDPISIHLFRLLAMMRIPIHINLLKTFNLYNEEQKNDFIEYSLLRTDKDSLYIDESIREVIERQIPESILPKLHKACLELYNTQLPLKPLERDLPLSRQTMRNEIEYHSLFLPKKQYVAERNLLEVPRRPQKEETDNNSKQKQETKEEQIKNINFIIEDEAVLENIADSIKDFVTKSIETAEITNLDGSINLTKIMNMAKQEEAKYNYKNANLLYQHALTKKDDDEFYKFLPTIYTNLAANYKKLSLWYEALEYYTQAQDFYYNISNKDKIAEIKLEIANIYFIIYKNDNAKFILNELHKETNLPNDIKIKVNLALGNISESNTQSYNFYEQALDLVDVSTEKGILAELYYRYACVNDEQNNIKTAITYYKKCIDIENSQNIYLSKALFNIAELYDDAGATNQAIKYYEESLNVDIKNKNYNGLYCSCRNLAEIYSAKDSQKSLEYLKLSMIRAKQLNEPYYIADTAMEIGNYHLLRKDFDNAYKYFIEAYNITKNSFINKSISEKILSKINDMKLQMNVKDFQKLKDKYEK